MTEFDNNINNASQNTEQGYTYPANNYNNMENQSGQGQQYGQYGHAGQSMYNAPIPPMPPVSQKESGFAAALAAVALFISCVAVGVNVYSVTAINDNSKSISSIIEAAEETAYDSDYFSDWLKGHDKDITEVQDKLASVQEKLDQVAAEVDVHCNIIRENIENAYSIPSESTDDSQQGEIQSVYGDGMYQFQTYADNFMVLKDLGNFYFSEPADMQFTLKYESDSETDPYYLNDNTVFKIIAVTQEDGGVERFDVSFVSKDDMFSFVNNSYQVDTSDEMVMTFESESRVVTSITVYTGRN